MPASAQSAAQKPGQHNHPRSSAARQPSTASVSAIPASGVALPSEENGSGLDAGAKAQPAPTQRRKPRKLNRAPASSRQVEVPQPQGPSLELDAEIDALKNRIKYLEVQVEELYQTAAPKPLPKQPRRRGRGRTALAPESHEELLRLERELIATQQELENLRTKPEASDTKHVSEGSTGSVPPWSADNDADDDAEIEEVHRTSAPIADSQRQVTLAGNYRIPLPATVSLDDVRAIQSGISSANNVVRGFMDAHRNQKPAQAKQTRPNVDNSGRGQSWSEWIGGYSMTVAKLVNNIEGEAAVEQRPATDEPSQRARKLSAARQEGQSIQRSKEAIKKNAAAQGANPRHNESSKSRRLSQQQVASLLS